MAAKIILSMDGAILNEYPLSKDRMTIGRKTHNDIVIDNLAVSGEHAAIVTILHDSFLEDLDSTNGLEVNGVPTKKHFLQNNDLIEIGKYKLKYINDHVTQTTSADFEKTMVLRAPVKQSAADVTPNAANSFMQTQINPEGEKNKSVPGETGRFDATQTSQIPVSVVPNPAVVSSAPVVASAVAAATGQPVATPVQAAAIQILTGPNAGKELDLVKNLTTLGKPGVQVSVLTRRPHGFFITHVEGATFPAVNGQALGDQPHKLNDHDVIELAGVKMEFYFK